MHRQALSELTQDLHWTTTISEAKYDAHVADALTQELLVVVVVVVVVVFAQNRIQNRIQNTLALWSRHSTFGLARPRGRICGALAGF